MIDQSARLVAGLHQRVQARCERHSTALGYRFPPLPYCKALPEAGVARWPRISSGASQRCGTRHGKGEGWRQSHQRSCQPQQ